MGEFGSNHSSQHRLFLSSPQGLGTEALQRLQLLELWDSGDLPFKIVGVTSAAAPAVLVGAQSMPKHCLPLHITRVTKVQLYSV